MGSSPAAHWNARDPFLWHSHFYYEEVFLSKLESFSSIIVDVYNKHQMLDYDISKITKRVKEEKNVEFPGNILSDSTDTIKKE